MPFYQPLGTPLAPCTISAEPCIRHLSGPRFSTLPAFKQAAASTTHPTPQPLPTVTFEDIGLHPPIIASLRAAFPYVHHPTDTQADFIARILKGDDVLLKDSTGSGKSFGLLLALLNKPRIVTYDKGLGQEKRHITSLVLVPHRDLAYQYLGWVERLVNASNDETQLPDISSVAQVLVRDENMHLGPGLDLLRQSAEADTPPHVLIATPQALLDIHKADPDFFATYLSSSTLSSVCVDEADYLIETLARKDASKSFAKAIEKARKKLARHPGPTKELLNIIYQERKAWNAREDKGDLPCPPSPQLVLSSATLRTHLRNYVYEESGWLDRRTVVKIHGATHKEAKSGSKVGLLHSVVLVSAERAINVDGAEPAPISVLNEETAGPSKEIEPPRGLDTETAGKYAQAPSPFNPYVIEAIATAFAVDVPSAALLVMPASASVSRVIWELTELGINACSLDLAEKRRIRPSPDNPTLFVSTLATTRGVDLPELSHVFIYGLPDAQKRVHGKSVDAYMHVAGRVGRFGRGGRVVTFVEDDGAREDEGVPEEGGRKGGEGRKMLRILETINVRPVKFRIFD